MPEEELYREIRLCSGKGSYEAIPRRKLELDLLKLKALLERSGLSVLDARVMLLVSGVPEMTVLRDARLLVKSRDRAQAEQAVGRLVPLVKECNTAQ
jgi:hypothetical protein